MNILVMQQGFSSIHKNREFLGIDSSFCKTDCIFGMASICRTCIEETLRRQFDFYDWDGSALATMTTHDYSWLMRVEGSGSPIPVASQHLLITLARAPQLWTGGDVSKKEKIFPFGGDETESTRYCYACFSKYARGFDHHCSARN